MALIELDFKKAHVWQRDDFQWWISKGEEHKNIKIT